MPLVVPEINARRIADHKGIIANPNCSAITTLVPLWPIHQVNPIKRLIISTYQAASGGGAALMEELEIPPAPIWTARTITPKVVKYPYAFNVFSHNTAIDMATGYNDEETKVIKETKKIFEDDQIARRRHLHPRAGAARPFGLHDLRMRAARSRRTRCARILAKAPGVKLVDDRAKNYFPMPQGCVRPGRCAGGPHPQGSVAIPVGQSISHVRGGGSALKGAALNAVQIAELL